MRRTGHLGPAGDGRGGAGGAGSSAGSLGIGPLRAAAERQRAGQHRDGQQRAAGLRAGGPAGRRRVQRGGRGPRKTRRPHRVRHRAILTFRGEDIARGAEQVVHRARESSLIRVKIAHPSDSGRRASLAWPRRRSLRSGARGPPENRRVPPHVTYHHTCLHLRTYQTFHPFRPMRRSDSASRPPSIHPLPHRRTHRSPPPQPPHPSHSTASARGAHAVR
ncbi:hypothetical protein GZL_03819 [Streptomyces sp. 769]|nr:hypothetical protein GZL_03819 [Streptomyces sp. 769]